MQRIAMLTFPGVRAFDVSVITEVWGVDRTAAGGPAFELRRCAPDNTPVAMSGGFTLTPDRTLSWLDRADLVVVPGLHDHDRAPEHVLDALRRAHRRGTTIAALCGGAFTLAQTGLLDGRRAVTHWDLVDRLAAEHPQIKVEPGALYLHDDNLWTSAGTVAGIDLCLQLVRTTHGAEAAAVIARSMVTAPHRNGSQAQFIRQPTQAEHRDIDTLAAVRERALSRLHEPLTVVQLANWAGMSARSFARHFAATTGVTPHRWLTDQRLSLAQQLLERTDLPMAEVARRAGFGSEVTMRQQFAARLETSPRAYRSAFNSRV